MHLPLVLQVPHAMLRRLLSHLAHSPLYGAAPVVWAKQLWPWSLQAFVEPRVFRGQSDASPADFSGINRCSFTSKGIPNRNCGQVALLLFCYHELLGGMQQSLVHW